VAVRLCVRKRLVNGIEGSKIQVSGRRTTTSSDRCSVSASKFAMVTSGMGWADGSSAPLRVQNLTQVASI
jgi:hypothetical protein